MDDSNPPPRNIGKFKISDDIMRDNWRDMLPLFAQMAVVRCEHSFLGYFAITAFSDLFEPTPHEIDAPHYEILVTEKRDDAGTRTLSFSAKKL